MVKALFSSDLPDKPLLYHYTSVKNTRLILDSGRIRLSSFEGTNDARESSPWHMSLQHDDDTEFDIETYGALQAAFDTEVRLRARVACFTADRDPDVGDAWAHEFHRGYARGRMWSQYANGHKGACLIFDQEELVRSARQELPSILFEQVTYEDRLVGPRRGMMMQFGTSEARKNLSEVAQRFAKEHTELFLTKNLDWRSEEEWRFLLLEDRELDTIREFSFGPALVAVVLGEKFYERGVNAMHSRVVASGLDGNRLGRASWFGGSPGVVPAVVD